MQAQLEEAEAQALAVLRLYHDIVSQFGSSTSALPQSRGVVAALAWLKSHIGKLPDFVDGAVDFGALAGVSFFARLLRRDGCAHAKAVQMDYRRSW